MGPLGSFLCVVSWGVSGSQIRSSVLFSGLWDKFVALGFPWTRLSDDYGSEFCEDLLGCQESPLVFWHLRGACLSVWFSLVPFFLSVGVSVCWQPSLGGPCQLP